MIISLEAEFPLLSSEFENRKPEERKSRHLIGADTPPRIFSIFLTPNKGIPQRGNLQIENKMKTPVYEWV